MLNNNGRPYSHPTVESILLLRDQEGGILVLWYPAIPTRVLREWMREHPQATITLEHNGNKKWVDGVKGRQEMCLVIFRGIASCCHESERMEEDLWRSLQIMVNAKAKGLCVQSWGWYFNETVQMTAEAHGAVPVL